MWINNVVTETVCHRRSPNDILVSWSNRKVICLILNRPQFHDYFIRNSEKQQSLRTHLSTRMKSFVVNIIEVLVNGRTKFVNIARSIVLSVCYPSVFINIAFNMLHLVRTGAFRTSSSHIFILLLSLSESDIIILIFDATKLLLAFPYGKMPAPQRRWSKRLVSDFYNAHKYFIVEKTFILLRLGTCYIFNIVNEHHQTNFLWIPTPNSCHYGNMFLFIFEHIGHKDTVSSNDAQLIYKNKLWTIDPKYLSLLNEFDAISIVIFSIFNLLTILSTPLVWRRMNVFLHFYYLKCISI